LQNTNGCAILLEAKFLSRFILTPGWEIQFLSPEKIPEVDNMADSVPQIYADIDWTSLRANALAKKGWQDKGPAEWDQKAKSFAGRNKSTAYVDLVLSHMPLEPSFTVLDIGSGPGTLAIPMAKTVKSVTAIDYSRGMLNILEEIAREEEMDNIQTVQCAWEDDWQQKGLQPHDVAVASRSMGVKDLKAALCKINRYGKRYVFLTDRIGSTPFDEGAFKAIGRSFFPGPDYIYTLNILYSMGIYPNVTILKLEQTNEYASITEAIKSYSWMFHEITPKEKIALEKYLTEKIIHSENGRVTVRRDSPPLWALIWWEKTTE
jgi:ubiquinone/menaquinone biosynthesis C-methylase UbiE